jgi:hypothetical protein
LFDLANGYASLPFPGTTLGLTRSLNDYKAQMEAYQRRMALDIKVYQVLSSEVENLTNELHSRDGDPDFRDNEAIIFGDQGPSANPRANGDVEMADEVTKASNAAVSAFFLMLRRFTKCFFSF